GDDRGRRHERIRRAEYRVGRAGRTRTRGVGRLPGEFHAAGRVGAIGIQRVRIDQRLQRAVIGGHDVDAGRYQALDVTRNATHLVGVLETTLAVVIDDRRRGTVGDKAEIAGGSAGTRAIGAIELEPLGQGRRG